MDRRPSGSKQDENVSARIDACGKGLQSMPRGNRKLILELGMKPNELPVVSRVTEQQHDPRTSEVALLGSDASDQGLNVVNSGLRLEHRIERLFTLQGIHAPPIAADRHRYFESQSTTWAETNAQPFEQRKLRSIPNWCSVRVEADSGIEAKDGGDTTDQIDRNVRHLAAFQPADRLM
jgi:hypothetical protein